MAARTFSAVLHQEDDLYVAECPQVGTVSQGYTVEEAINNLKEATELYLEEVKLPEIENIYKARFMRFHHNDVRHI